MKTAVLVAIAMSLLFTVAAPHLGRRLPPATATRLLAPASLLVAFSTASVLAMVAATWVGQVATIAALGSWSSAGLRATDPIPAPAAIAATLLLPPAAMWALYVIARRCKALVDVCRTCRRFLADGPLVVVETDQPDAFTTPQLPGRIVVTTGLLRALTPLERRVVLAHETSHLRHRHTWWVLAADLAAAVNPLLQPTARVVAHATERWADEDAAHEVVDRRLAARALARTALVIQHFRRDRVVLAAASSQVSARVRALLVPAPRRRPIAMAVVVALSVVISVATLAVQHHGEELFENTGNHSGRGPH